MRYKSCYCYTCDRPFHSLGIMRHRAMHRDKRENCKIELKDGVYTYEYANRWIKYNVGDYKKKFYDIKLHHGVIFLGCWPNAGFFNSSEYGNFAEELIGWVRESELNDLGMPTHTGAGDV